MARVHSYTPQTSLVCKGGQCPASRGQPALSLLPALAALSWKTPSQQCEQRWLHQLLYAEPWGPSFKRPHKPSIQGAAAGGELCFQTGLRHPPLPGWHRPTREAPPITAPSLLPPPTQFSKKQYVRSGSDNAGPETWRTDLSQTRPSGLVSAQSKRSRVTGVIAVSCGSEARRSGPFPGRVRAPPPPARSHTQSPLYGNKAGQALAVSASGKPRFGFSPRAQPSLCLDFALSPLAGLLCGYTASRTQAPPANPSKVGHKETPQRTARDVHLALNTTYVSHHNLTGPPIR